MTDTMQLQPESSPPPPHPHDYGTAADGAAPWALLAVGLLLWLAQRSKR